MILGVNYLKLKKQLLKHYRNTRVYIETKGEFNTRFWIDKSKIIINRNRIVIANEDIDCNILLDYIKKFKSDSICRIELIGKESTYILEL